MTRALPYWVASCLRAEGAMVGAMASTSCSNSARVTTVLQSAVLDLSTGGLSQMPAIVITAAVGATVAVSGALAVAVCAAGGGFGGAAGLCDCLHAGGVNKNKQIDPR